MVTASQIDRALDEAFSVVLANCKPSELPKPRKKYSWSKRELQGYAQKGMTVRDVADVLGVSRNSVIGAAWRHGVALRRGKAGRPRKVGR